MSLPKVLPRVGDQVAVRTASNEWLPKIACSTWYPGRFFPCVYVTSPELWRQGMEHGQRPEDLGVGWPLEDVIVLNRLAHKSTADSETRDA